MFKYIPPRNSGQVFLLFKFNTNFEKIFSRKPFFYKLRKLLIKNSKVAVYQPLGFLLGGE